MNRKRILALLLSLILIFSVFGSACTKGEEDGGYNSAPTENEADSAIITYEYFYEEKEDEYAVAYYAYWRNDVTMLTTPQTYHKPYYKRVVPWHKDSGVEPNSTIVRKYEYYRCYTYVSSAVYEFLESGNATSRQFLLRKNKKGKDNGSQTWLDRDAEMSAWFAERFSGSEIVEKVGMITWEGTAEELLTLAGPDSEVLVCFPEDFEHIFGMTVEDAKEMIEKGKLDIWSSPVSGSPLYGLPPAEIAAYIAAHPEILEE